MKSLECLGAAGEVTGSANLLDDRVLVDFGMFQGLAKSEKSNHEQLSFDPRKLDGVILTHAHLDHSGRLPILIRLGFKGKIFMTEPSADLVALVLKDSINVALQNGERPLYTTRELNQTLNQIEKVPYNQVFDIGNFTAVLRDVGHILGSASAALTDKNLKGRQTIAFSGDLGNTSGDIVAPIDNITHADIVVMESTYGDKNHPLENPREVIQNEVNQIERQKGTLLTPSFSLQRTQLLLHIFQWLKETGKIDSKTPVFLDTPMGIRATDIYRRYHYGPFFKDESRERYRDPFVFKGLVPVYHCGRDKDKEMLKAHDGPRVIIAGSGMMNGGKIRQHAINYLPRENSRILFVGYLAEGSLGREIAEGKEEVVIDGRCVPVRAVVSKIGSLSSHADKEGLIWWSHAPNGVRLAILNHGEDRQRKALAKTIIEMGSIREVVLPQRNQRIPL